MDVNSSSKGKNDTDSPLHTLKDVPPAPTSLSQPVDSQTGSGFGAQKLIQENKLQDMISSPYLKKKKEGSLADTGYAHE